MWELTSYVFDLSADANGSDSDTKPITISKDFWLCEIAIKASGDFKLTIHNTEARRDVLSGIKVSSLIGDATNIVGTWKLPILRRGYSSKEEGTKIVGQEIFKGGSSIEVSVTDISGSSNTIQVSLIGYHVDRGAPAMKYEGEE